MGRFLASSPRNSERGQRYLALPSSTDDDDHSSAMGIETQLPVSTRETAASARAALGNQQATTENNRQRDDEVHNEAETIRLETVRSTTRMLGESEREESRAQDNRGDQANEENSVSGGVGKPEESEESKKEHVIAIANADNNADGSNSGDEDGEELEPGMIRIRILDLNGKFYSMTCRLDDEVLALKRKVTEATEVAIASQRLIYRGRVLEDEKTLDDYKVEDGHTIHLFVRMAPTPADEEADQDGMHAGSGGANGHGDGGMPITMVHVSSDTVSSAVFPSDSARRVDPLMLDCPLGNAARRVKLWSSFFLIIYTMKVMGQFALLANDQQLRKQREENDDNRDPYDRFAYPPYANQDPTISAIELLIHAFGVYIGCVGFKAAHDTDIRPIRFFCRGVIWLAILTIAEQIFVTVQISSSDYPNERIQYPYGGQMPSKDDIVSANVFQIVMLVVMWIIAIHHAYVHQMELRRYNESFAQAAMNAVPAPTLPEVV